MRVEPGSSLARCHLMPSAGGQPPTWARSGQVGGLDRCLVCQGCDELLASEAGVPPRPPALHRHSLGPWLHLMSEAAHRSNLDAWTGMAGKYLFFSPRASPLIAVAQAEIEGHGFRLAKLKLGELIGPDHVLYLYWHDGSRGQELAERWAPAGEPEGEIRYRRWKSEHATLRGVYSEQFLRNREEYARQRGRPA